jgi:DNA-directed RNA polymerase specialized sigma24 family protein
MDAPIPITFWINQLKAGDADAARRLWEAYRSRMEQQADRKLAGLSPGAGGAEDAANMAFKGFLSGVRKTDFPNLGDRENLWQLLFTLTERKAINLARRETSRKRGGGKVKPLHPDAPLAAPAPPPEMVVEIADRIEHLGDAALRAVAVGVMMGYTQPEIAKQLGCTVRSVEYKVTLIREIWEAADE